MTLDHFRYVVDRRSDPNSVGCNRCCVARVVFFLPAAKWKGAVLFFHTGIFWVARVFPALAPVRPSQDGERAERLTNTLFGAKSGEHHHRQHASALTSFRRMRRRCT